MSTKLTTMIASALLLALIAAQRPAGARGFGGGGGFRGGGGFGGGGFRGGGVEGGGFRGGGFQGGGYRGGGVEGGGFRGGGFQGGGYRGGGVEGGGFRDGGFGGYGGGYGGRANFGGAGGGGYGGGRINQGGVDNRFGVGNRSDIGQFNNRTNIGNQFGVGDRNTGINRSFDGGNRVNFTNNNRTNIGVNTGNINRISNSGNINRVNIVNVNGSRWGNPYSAYHQGWVHGYWNGHNSNAWGWRGGYWGGGAWGFGAGLGLGWGLSSWGFGSSLYNWGYMPYYNPYYVTSPVVVQQPVVVSDQPVTYDYSQPIDTTGSAPAQSVTDQAVKLFDDARGFFMKGDYTQALALADQALAKIPNDSALHEFRALVLFAIKRYDEAAAALYAVLSVGPGWDWTTLISLYPNVDVYTEQLRALEAYCRAHPDSSSGRFVLAYQYLTEGHNEPAIAMLREVVKLKPDDRLSAQLLSQLSPKAKEDATPPAPAGASRPLTVDTTPPAGATVEGTWKASPAPDTMINLTIGPGGPFTWSVDQKGQKRQFSGTSTYGDGILTLAQDKGPPLVGRVAWRDANHVTFHVVGDGPETPGLTFSK